MSEEHLLPYALSIIGVLLSSLIALVVYVFLSLRGEVRDLSKSFLALQNGSARLVNRTECRETTTRIHDRLDAQGKEIADLGQRVAKMEERCQ